MGNKKEYAYSYQKKYRNTPYGRAAYLVYNYKKMDEKNGFGIDACNLTAKWIIENIFSKKCVHCGESDWHKLGCNRIDNSKPHTMDNVEPCCFACNNELNWDERREKVYQYTFDGNLVKEWDSACECGRNGFMQSHISECIKGNKKQYKGYLWLNYKI